MQRTPKLKLPTLQIACGDPPWHSPIEGASAKTTCTTYGMNDCWFQCTVCIALPGAEKPILRYANSKLNLFHVIARNSKIRNTPAEFTYSNCIKSYIRFWNNSSRTNVSLEGFTGENEHRGILHSKSQLNSKNFVDSKREKAIANLHLKLQHVSQHVWTATVLLVCGVHLMKSSDASVQCERGKRGETSHKRQEQQHLKQGKSSCGLTWCMNVNILHCAKLHTALTTVGLPSRQFRPESYMSNSYSYCKCCTCSAFNEISMCVSMQERNKHSKVDSFNIEIHGLVLYGLESTSKCWKYIRCWGKIITSYEVIDAIFGML